MKKPLHEKLGEDFSERIESGVWKVGDRLPTEQQLSRTLDVSRATVRRALASLESKGLIERRKRAGTTVIADKSRTSFQQLTGGLPDVLRIADTTSLSISAIEDVPNGASPRVADFSSTTGFWLKIVGVRSFVGGDRVAWSEMYVDGAFSGIRPWLDDGTRSIYALIESTFGVKVERLKQQVYAVACPDRAASELGLKPASPCLYIAAEIYCGDDRLIELTGTYFHPDRFSVGSDVRLG